MIISFFGLLFLIMTAVIEANPTPIAPEQVLVVYNQSVKEAKELAEFYAVSRQIPPSNLIALSCIDKNTIDRKAYNEEIRDPLRKTILSAGWWELEKNDQGILAPTKSSIRCLVTLKGLPLRIKREAIEDEQKTTNTPHADKNEAAVDSELSLLGVIDYPLGGPLPNPYFNKEAAFVDLKNDYQLLVSRIDGPSFDHCRRIILDSLEAEKKGLWGRTYIDEGGPYKLADQWMEALTEASLNAGIPTITDRTKDTFVTNYPMTDAAFYFGWYTLHCNGPFLNREMKFKPGAIAVHLHSFSAAQLTNPAQNWCAGLIDRGACATIGNTWEPYLEISHNFEIFFDRLLKGYSLVEASSMAMNAISWQNIVIGDPLYRPFTIRASQVTDFKQDLAFKALRLAQSKWPDPLMRSQELAQASLRMKEGSIEEFLGYQALQEDNIDLATSSFRKAEQLFKNPADKLRQHLNLVEIKRRNKDHTDALALLRSAEKSFKKIPEATAIKGLITILDPPAPPPARSKK